MHLAYLIAAAIGCTVLIAQVGLQLLGMDADSHAGGDLSGDVEFHEGESNLFFGVLSFKTLSAFVAFFGLAGLACEELGVESRALQFAVASLSGVAAGAVVVVLMRLLVSLNSSGTGRLEDAVGRTARVLLKIPGNDSGRGKVVVDIGGREVEVYATTDGPDIATGASVEVIRHTEGETFEVIRV